MLRLLSEYLSMVIKSVNTKSASIHSKNGWIRPDTASFLSSDFSQGGRLPYKEKLSSLFLGFMTHPNVRVLPEGCQSPWPFRFHGSISCKKSWGLGRHDDTYLISMVLLTIAAFSLKNLETVAAGMGISQEVWMETVWLIFPRVISSCSAPPVSSCSKNLFTNFLHQTHPNIGSSSNVSSEIKLLCRSSSPPNHLYFTWGRTSSVIFSFN